MAHGNPRIDVCHTCKHYIMVNRFSQDPNCPICGKKAEQTNRSDLKERYKIGLFDFIEPGFINWVKIIER